jgi:hypothetical protein
LAIPALVLWIDAGHLFPLLVGMFLMIDLKHAFDISVGFG